MVVILIWRFGKFTKFCVDNNQMIPFMSVLLTIFAKLNTRQFALHCAKCIAYT